MAAYTKEKKNLDTRLKKAEGQIKGIRKMVDNEKYCVDILNQISAVKGALKKIELIILEEHTKGCVIDSIKNDSKEHREKKINELLKTIEKMI